MDHDLDRRLLLTAAAAAATSIPVASLAATVHGAEGSPLRTASRQPIVRTQYGSVRGFNAQGVNVFRGVPYGASTAGANRFMPPRPPASWEGVRDTLNYGYQVPQGVPSLSPTSDPPPQDAFLLYRNWTPHQSSEDCLRLNVWAPEGSGRRPVLVYMHGGGLAYGSGNDLLAYDGENLARRGDAVVITHNHRLNVFGFLDLSGFGERWKQSANLGLQDNVAVLRWIRENIARFGGDPDNVTIFGQSGGGVKVHALMRMPSAKGLFHKAIIQSGVIGGFGSISPEAARALTERVLAKLGIAPQDTSRLSDLTPERLCEATADIGFGWSPVHGGSVLPEPLNPSTAPSLSRGIPMMIGTVLNEFVTAVDTPVARDFSRESMVAALARHVGADAEALTDAYLTAHPRLPLYEAYGAAMAALAREPSFQLADAKFAQDGKVWQYVFAWRTPVLGGTPGTFHSAEIAFVFDNARLCVNQTGGGPEAVRLAGQVSDAWLAFARRGDPAHAGLPAWPSFDRWHPTMILDSPCRLERDPEAAGRAIIRRHGGIDRSGS